MESLKIHSSTALPRLAAKAAMAGTFIGVLIGATGSAFADSFCGAGRHMGAENDGAGQSWKCVPDVASRMLPSVSSGSGAGLQGAAAGLQGLAAILSIASGLGSMISPTDSAAGPVETLETANVAARSRDLNQQAIAAMRAGQFKRAALLFNSAGNDALAAQLFDDYHANMKNAQIADAENMLVQGYTWEQKGDLAKASQFYLRGKQAAESAGAKDLAGKLATYNDQLIARAGGTNGGVHDTGASCSNLNGQLICR